MLAFVVQAGKDLTEFTSPAILFLSRSLSLVLAFIFQLAWLELTHQATVLQRRESSADLGAIRSCLRLVDDVTGSRHAAVAVKKLP